MPAIHHLDLLEAEAIEIIRESVAEFKRPTILFSGGKDSLTMLHLAEKAFAPAPLPLSLLHIDTGHNFPETLSFRDQIVASHGLSLMVASVEETIQSGRAREESGRYASRNAIQAVTLLETIRNKNIDACLGGARRDEEKARAKERIFSIRNAFGEWNPQAQRPELWHLYNTKLQHGENMRIFPLSNWTERDVWEYIDRENIAIPSLYFTHERKVVFVDGVYLPISPFIQIEADVPQLRRQVRFRTVGDMSCTAAILSEAATVPSIIEELKNAKVSERGSRLDDRRSASAMEERKKQGYF